MFINKESIKVNGVNMGQYLLSVEYGYNKLWGSDTGRNMLGSNSGTLLGIFPKLKFTFKKTTQQELETLAPILDSASQNLTYYDPVLKRHITISTYTGDWATTNSNSFQNVARANESFEISFIANDRRPNK